MLTLGPNSTCDICLEHFGTDHKAPYSIRCGHVFCYGCIRRVSPPECPLCRTQYADGKWMKLHVDLSALSQAASAPPPTGTEKEARRLQEAIGELTTLGSSETNLRQLINDCRGFLSAQPRSMYADLRVTYRVLSYLCEVKVNLRTQNAAVESLQYDIAQLAAEKEQLENLQHLKKSEVAKLEADKAELRRRLAASEAARDKDKQFATDLESRLNEYVTRAEGSYQSLFIVQDFANLNEELRELRSKVLDHAKYAAQSSNLEGLPQLSSYGLDEGYSTSPSSSSGSYLSSSHELPVGASPPFIGPFTTAPEAKMEHKHGEVYSRKKLYQCDAEDHPVSCYCDACPNSSPSKASKRTTMPIPTFIIERTGPGRRRDSVSPQITAPERQSGLSRSAPKDQELAKASDRSRLRSLSDVSPIPTRPPSRHQDRSADDDSQPSSESASRSSSPEPDASMNRRRDESPNESVRRLYNILQKPRSSSPPEFTASPNSMLKPRHTGSRSPSRSRSGSTVSIQATPAAAQPPANSYPQPPLQPPSNVISRASDAAMAIEKSQKEKALKEREREKDRHEHRKLDKDVDGDRVRPEPDRSPRKKSSGTSVTHTSSHSGGSAGSSQRDTYMPAQSANSTSQKTTAISASGTLGRNNSVKVSSGNYSSQRDGSTSQSHPSHQYRHGSGSNRATSGTTPIAV